MSERSWGAAAAAPRATPLNVGPVAATLTERVVEELLAELAQIRGVEFSGHEETYRLLIGVAIRNPNELERLREQTVAPLVGYDAKHETELVQTLQEFLTHDGSTSETAEAMRLHRHTVGYRLARVHEVSGLSPYESDGRERLSLGLKAHEILRAVENISKSEHL